MQKVHFLNNDRELTLRSRKEFKLVLEQLFRKEGKRLESLTYIFCSDKYILGINKQFLSHDYYTDVITFTLSEPGSPVIGEVYISIDRVKDNARSFGISFSKELQRVLFHAALHLCGYKDKTNNEIRLMRTKEDEYLDKFKNRKPVPQKTVSR